MFLPSLWTYTFFSWIPWNYLWNHDSTSHQNEAEVGPGSSFVTSIFKYMYKIFDIPLQLVKIKAQLRQVSFTMTYRRHAVPEISDKHMHSQLCLQPICSSCQLRRSVQSSIVDIMEKENIRATMLFLKYHQLP